MLRTKKPNANSAYRTADTDATKTRPIRFAPRGAVAQANCNYVSAAMHGEETTNRDATHARAPP